jgi:hypothetical protein
MERLSSSMKKASILYSNIAKTYGAIGEKGLGEVFSAMSETHSKISATHMKSREKLMEDINKFFRFYRHELNSMEELISKCRAKKEQLNVFEQTLKKKKESLFDRKQIAKWEVDGSREVNMETVLSDKALSFEIMLPKENKEAAILRSTYGFFLNSLAQEFIRSCDKNNKTVRQHLTRVGNDYLEIEMQVKVVIYF